ncbi:TIGR03619 family F420-dependent LLM class oxidoreductase [Nocardioides sp. Bht2]|uniref:TIGR03619 family F420-dependent LLM class oxidoreductase n=1 Tax=Nocardioides sp. Bht2 TaxID=3392297 RepID=UPI0039B4B006
MKFSLQYPIEHAGYDARLLDPSNIRGFLQTAEVSGFSAVGFSEHPAPSAKWMRNGGHPTFDLTAILAFAAAHTERISLLSHLMVLPYRNPLAAAKTLATLQMLSAGRLIAGVGGGYLRSEFEALGVEHAARADLLDEALAVVSRSWTGEPLTVRGRHFDAADVVMSPLPAEGPPPIWIGGNSRRALRRVARFGSGWAPVFGPGPQGAASGAIALETVDQLAEAIGELRGLVAGCGRDPLSVDVHVQLDGQSAVDGAGRDRHLAQLAELAEVGVTWTMVKFDPSDQSALLDSLRRYGADVIAGGSR